MCVGGGGGGGMNELGRQNSRHQVAHGGAND